jgi:hypothetical protein
MNDMKKDSFVISRPKSITRSGRLYMLILLKHLKMVGSREFRWKERKEFCFLQPWDLYTNDGYLNVRHGQSKSARPGGPDRWYFSPQEKP